MIDATNKQVRVTVRHPAAAVAVHAPRRFGVATAPRVWSDSEVGSVPQQPLGAEIAEDEERDASARRTRLDGLFKEHAGYVARLAFRLLGREDEVDDIVQDVFVMLYRQLDNIRQIETIRAWLGTTTVRMSRRRLRVRRIGFLLRLNERVDSAELQGAGPQGEERAALWNIHRALEHVPVNSRIAWTFRYLEQASVEEVAHLCGCSRSTAKRRIAEAHAVVKKAVFDE